MTARQIFSPSRASATGTAAARSTAACRMTRSSMRAGLMLCPPRMMTSFLRPVMRRYPFASSQPRSPVMNQPCALKELSVLSWSSK